MKQVWPLHAIALLFFALLGGAYYFHSSNYLADPDRYFHLALSRHMVEDHDPLPRTLPQVQGLHWDRYFPDKEFLFHQLTSLGYRLHGESGVIGITLFVAFLNIVLLYFLSTRFVNPYLAFIATLVGISSPYFCTRETMLRPHVLAIFFFLLMLFGILERRRFLTATATAMLALSYHALVIPLTLMISALLTFLLFPEKNSRNWKLLFWSFFGLVIGILLNPYFPSNLRMTWIHLKIPDLIQSGFAGLNFGQELYPLNTRVFRYLFWGDALIFFFALLSFKKDEKNLLDRQNKFFLTLASAAFFLASLECPRGGEYWAPISAVLLALLFKISASTRFFQLGIALASLFLPLSYFTSHFLMPAPQKKEILQSQVIPALDQVPQGAFLFHCEWDAAPRIFYQRPDLRFIDILDPSFLYFADEQEFLARQSLLDGNLPDPYGLIHNAFHAEYVLCKNPTVIRELQRDPDFSQLYPPLNPQDIASSPYALFRTNPMPVKNFLSHFRIAFIPANKKNFRAKNPKDATNFIEVAAEKSSYLNLFPIFKQHENQEVLKGDALCALTKTNAKEIANHKEAAYLAVGGGRNLRVWRNGKPLYSSEWAFPQARRIHVLVPIKGGIKEGDEFELMSCSSRDAPYWGIALSLWSEKDLRSLCKKKTAQNTWEFSGGDSDSCLGPILTRKEDE